jgi:hypothetical protein
MTLRLYLSMLVLGAAATSVFALQWGANGVLVAIGLCGISTITVTAFVVYGRQRLNEASEIVDWMP